MIRHKQTAKKRIETKKKVKKNKKYLPNHLQLITNLCTFTKQSQTLKHKQNEH